MFPTRPFAKLATPRFVEIVGVSVLDLADASRDAGLEFLNGSAGGWGRKDLAHWLVGSYRHATSRVSARKAVLALVSDTSSGTLEDGAVERIILTARERLLEMLSLNPREWESSGIAREAVDSGLVVGVHDGVGGIGYSPLDAKGMRLYDRVTSLFLADYLTRPRDYDSLSICPDCGEVSFAWAKSDHFSCEEPPVESGIVRRATAPGVGNSAAT